MLVIQIVGRLVQQEHGRLLQKQFGQQHFGPLTAGEGGNIPIQAEGGKAVTGARNGQWISFDPYAPAGVSKLTARVAGKADGAIEVRTGSPDGPLLGTAKVSATSGWSEVSTAIGDVPQGADTLFLVFTGGDGALFDLDSFTVTTG